MLSNHRHERFAALIAAGKSLGAAYTGAGYGKAGAKQSAAKLLKRTEVAARVDELRREVTQAIVQRSIGDKQTRVESLIRDYELLEELRIARSLDPDTQRGPGGHTGLIVYRAKVIGSGDNAQNVDEYEFDRAWMAEARAIREQVGRELGQITDKRETRVIRSLDDLTTGELEAIVSERKADARS